MSKRSASVGCILEGHYKTVDQLMKYAFSDLKEEYLPQANECKFGFSSTEPSVVTNIHTIRTAATLEKEHWVLNGSKTILIDAQRNRFTLKELLQQLKLSLGGLSPLQYRKKQGFIC